VSKHPLKKVKASGGCHRIGKEFFVQAQSRFRTQLCQGIIDQSPRHYVPAGLSAQANPAGVATLREKSTAPHHFYE